jgi:hypothetical protein
MDVLDFGWMGRMGWQGKDWTWTYIVSFLLLVFKKGERLSILGLYIPITIFL